MKPLLILLLVAASIVSASAQSNTAARDTRKYDISVSLDPSLKGPYTGTLRLYTQKDTSRGFSGEHSLDEPAFSIEVKNWVYGEKRMIDATARAQYVRLADVKPGYYKMIAILDTNTIERGNTAPGNLYTRNEGILEVTNDGASGSLVLTHVFPDRKFASVDSLQEIVLASALLSSFRKMPIFHKAGIYLPPSYFTDSKREFPVVYIIPGWGGTHHQVLNPNARRLYGAGLGEEKIYVYLNPEAYTPYGLHAYVDSRVNGPWGTALIKELMPHIQRTFRASKDPRLTFVMGQSSGGYGGLWLALHFPSQIGGAWLTAPDPVDFSNFVGVNIYKDKNAFADENGNERGTYFINGKPLATLREGRIKAEFDGDGSQEQSFAAEFGLPDKNGRPIDLYDTAGLIRKHVAESWKPYDMSLYVKANAAQLKKQMIGPVKVYAGTKDNFLLDKSVALFGEKIKPLGLNIQVIMIEGADHFSTRTEKLAGEIAAEMDAIIRKVRK